MSMDVCISEFGERFLCAVCDVWVWSVMCTGCVMYDVGYMLYMVCVVHMCMVCGVCGVWYICVWYVVCV